jgi:RNA polymerase sigma factor (sigma-70 family)
MTFEEFASAQLPAVLRFAAVLAGDRVAGEDLAQEVLIRAYSRWDRIGGLDRPEFYVRKMILNEFLSWRRRSARQARPDVLAELATAVPDHAEAYSEREALLRELSKLPRRGVPRRHHAGVLNIRAARAAERRPEPRGRVHGRRRRALVGDPGSGFRRVHGLDDLACGWQDARVQLVPPGGAGLPGVVAAAA